MLVRSPSCTRQTRQFEVYLHVCFFTFLYFVSNIVFFFFFFTVGSERRDHPLETAVQIKGVCIWCWTVKLITGSLCLLAVLSSVKLPWVKYFYYFFFVVHCLRFYLGVTKVSQKANILQAQLSKLTYLTGNCSE